jgi:translation initiation factor IF-1
MVKNVNGGNKAKKQKRGFQKKAVQEFTVQGQMFGQVVENRGDHFAILCADNVKRIGRLSGAAKRGQRLLTGSFVIISVRDYETDQKNCDVVGAGNPPADVRNIFRKINPIAGDDINISFYTENEKFKEFEDSEVSKKNNSNITVIPLGDLPIDRTSKPTDVFDDTGDDIYLDPTVRPEQIDWDDI